MRMTAAVLFTIFAAFASSSWACNDHAPGTEPAHRSVGRPASLATGEVKEVDLEEGTITLGHGRIANLRMAPMSSMVFKAGNPKLLMNLKPGDRVKFRATMAGEQPTLTQIVLARK